jgi:hypothetical protein
MLQDSVTFSVLLPRTTHLERTQTTHLYRLYQPHLVSCCPYTLVFIASALQAHSEVISKIIIEREIGLHLFLYEFWWLNCPTQINWTN